MIIKVFGCPGGGKTQYIVNYVRDNRKEIGRTLITSFTRSSQQTLFDRIADKENIDILTLHSLVAKKLSLFSFVSEVNIREAFLSLGISYSANFLEKGEIYRNFRPDTLNEAGNLFYSHFAVQAQLNMGCREYYNVKKLNFCSLEDYIKVHTLFYSSIKLIGMDYTNTLKYAVNEYRDCYDTVIIDEFQDITPLMWSVIKKIKINKTLLVAGDADQNIFEWAGSDPSLMINLKADQVIELTNSKRCAIPIAENAMQLISRNQKRHNYTWTGNGDGVVAKIGIERVCELADPKVDTLILTYLTKDYQNISRELIKHNIAHDRLDQLQVIPKALFEFNKMCKLLKINSETTIKGEDLAMIINIINPTITQFYGGREKLKRNFNAPEMGLNILRKHTFFDHLLRVFDRNPAMCLTKKESEVYKKWSVGLNDPLWQHPKIHVGTIHTSKGMEATNTIVLCNEKDEDIEYMRRVKYVAITRAKKKLLDISDSIY